MSRAFSRPRLEALVSHRVRSYLAYAAGEIVLIFIGITLALTFNNWNEARQLADLERSSLRDLLVSLEKNAAELQGNIESDREMDSLALAVIDHLDSGEPWNESLAEAYARIPNFASPYFVTAAYEQLKSRGLHVISNASVRNAIVHLYDDSYQFLIADIDRAMWMVDETLMFPMAVRHIRWDAVTAGAISANLVALRDQSLLANLLSQKRLVLSGAIARKGDALEETRALIELIEAELAR
jgi:hypothetical protein